METLRVALPYRGTLTRAQYEAGVRAVFEHPLAALHAFARVSREDGGSLIEVFFEEDLSESAAAEFTQGLVDAFDQAVR